MFNEPIKDRLAGVSFAFLTDEEVRALSVVEVNNLQTFDSLMNPTPHGLHDKRLGVSPFDRNASCVTCGLNSTQCPGHHGHISLVAPSYNPFLIKDLYRLMKAKCFQCHHLRIPDHKIDVFVNALKLLKVGQVVQSQRLKQHFMNLASELVSSKDIALLSKVAQALANAPSSKTKDQVKKAQQQKHASDEEALRLLQRRQNIQKEQFEHDILELVKSIELNEEGLCAQSADQTSIMKKMEINLIKEMWASVITTKCPLCKFNSPAFRKDGYTKMFVKPLSGKAKGAADQRSRISSKNSATDASTTHQSKRGTSTANEDSDEPEENYMVEELESLADEEFKEGTQQKFISPTEVRDHITKLWNTQGQLLDLVYGKYEAEEGGQPVSVSSLGSSMFFLNNVVVPPTRFRPESEGGAGARGSGAYLHTHSSMLLRILTSNNALKDALLDQSRSMDQEAPGNKKTGKLGITTQRWIQLQEAINCFMDSSMASKNADKEQGGVRQLLEKKEGMFRMKMMGKRVNYGGRSVISPDPYITTDQIGVPVFMARKLTFPESVASFNADRLRQAVINGTKVHPGANMIEDEETGQQTHLDQLSKQQREGLAKLLTVGRKVVYRHLRNNDPLLVNRQPTLHKPSIMAHLCRVLPKEQTLRMHYANCSTYNADFDGDEMNIHLPQSYQAHSEAYQLMATHRQYCVPTSGKPIRGLIQDSVVAGVFLTSKDTFLSKEQYNQLVYIGLRELIETDKIDRISTLPPTLLKPKPLWTGKQVISTLLKNIVNKEQEFKAKSLTGLNVAFKSKLSAKEWGPIGKEEADVLFRDNEHLRGTLDKGAFGSTDFGLVHAFYEVYGSEKAGELLTSLARVFAVYLQTHGFTCGLDDLMVRKDANKSRREVIEQGHKDGMKAAAEFCKLENFQAPDLNYSNRVIRQSKANHDPYYEKLSKIALPKNPFKDKKCVQHDNELRKALELKMSTAGSDKEFYDEELDGRMQGRMHDATSKVLKEIVPKGLIKRFPQNNLSAMVLTGAKGGVVNQTQISVLLGQQSLEGRRVPKMQNGKTLPCYLPYDPNPRSSGYISDRFLTGLRPQDFYFHCMAGREGLIDTAVKTSRSGYLQRCLIKQLESLIVHYDMTVRDNDGSVVQFMYGDDGVDVTHSKYLDKFDFLEQNFNSLITSGKDLISKVDQTTVPEFRKQSRKTAKLLKKANPEMSARQALTAAADPLLSLFHPQRYFGAISENVSFGIDNYIKRDCQFVKLETQEEQLLKRKYKPILPETFQKMYYMKYMKSLVHAGENVGTIAGQSVGEPSTQMTLNTFHLAGHGAGNMTLGIPRLKEILMTTPYNIKTPIMNVYFRKDRKVDLDKCQKFANKFQKLKMTDVVKQIKVTQGIARDQGGYKRVYDITLVFEAIDALVSNLGIDHLKLAQLFSDHFLPQLMAEIFKHFKKDAADRQGSTVVSAQFEDGLGGQKAKASKQISKMRTSGSSKQGLDHEVGEGEDMETSTKDLKKSKLIEEDEGKKRGEDEDDDISDDEKEIMNEVNNDLDGNLKMAKDVRGYDDSDSLDQDEAPLDPDAESQDHSEPGSEKKNKNGKLEEEGTGIDKFTNLHRLVHNKYLQYLSIIDFTPEKNCARVSVGFPLDFKKVLMLTLVEQTLQKVLVRSVPGIEKCILVKPKKEGDEPFLVVQGINFDALYPHQDIIDVNRLETNHSYALSSKYGVEAMRANIMKEVQMVFGVYGISVDKRHLSLICDFMTFNGEYRAFNRIGMEESSSPFLKMSYETTMKYLVGSSQANETDNMSTPSSAIVMGQVPRVGTNMFDLIQQKY